MRKIYRKVVLDSEGHVLEEDSYLYDGPMTMAGGGGGGQSTNTVEKADPWAPIQPYLLYGAGEAYRLYRQPGPNLYPGETIVDYSPQELAAMGGLTNTSLTQMLPTASAALAGNQFLSSGAALYPSSNPALRAYMREAVRPVFQSMAETALPAVRSGASAAGQYGGSRQGIMEALAMDRAMQNASRITSGLASSAYGQGLQAMTKAQAAAPLVMQAGQAPWLALSSVGQAQREMQQAKLDEQVRRYQYQQLLPYEKLAQYLDYITASGGGGQFKQLESATKAAERSTTSRVVGGLGGAAGGALLGYEVSGGNPIGAVIGGLLGGLLGGLS